MIRLVLAAYLLLSLCCAYQSWGSPDPAWLDDGEFVILGTVTPVPSPTPRQDCRITPSKAWRGLCAEGK